MNAHDPICLEPLSLEQQEIVSATIEPVYCDICIAIAKARADEREKAAKRIWTLKPDRVYTSGGIAYTDALKDAIEAVYGRADIVRGES